MLKYFCIIIYFFRQVLCTDFGGGQSWTKRAMKRSVETRVLFCIRGQNEVKSTHVKISHLVNKLCSQQACNKLVNKL